MKRTIQALLLTALFAGTQAGANDGFSANGDVMFVPPAWTYADRNGGGIAVLPEPGFPANGDVEFVTAQSTYADRHADTIAGAPGYEFPPSGDVTFLPPAWTYADHLDSGRASHARAEADPAGSR